MNKKTVWPVIALVAVVLAIVGIMIYVSTPKAEYSQAEITNLAKALATASTTMYGAAWCPHCQAQKALFGAAFEYVPYVECPNNEKLCIDKGVRGYPTWITKDGRKYEGEQTLENLSVIAGYRLAK